MPNPRILLVEDNQVIGEAIFSRLSTLGTVAWLISESDFLREWDNIIAEPPHVAVVDVMLRWDYPRPDRQPMEKDQDALYTAGIRCAQKLQSVPQTEHVPVILYTVIGKGELLDHLRDLPDVIYLQKEPELGPLVEMVREVTTRAPSRAR